MEAVLQMELFPGATSQDYIKTKEYLSDYRLMSQRIRVYGNKPHLSETEQLLLAQSKRIIREIDLAFELILDDEVKKILKHRYITAGKHKQTIATYSASSSIPTINRRIDAGVQTIAECLKIAGVL